MAGQKFLYVLLAAILSVFVGDFVAHTAIEPHVTSPDLTLLKTAFPKNERIVYDLTWFGIKAGDITLTVNNIGGDKRRIVAVAKSSPLFSLFYPVEDRFVTEVSGPQMLPRWIVIRQREGNYRSLKRAIFDQAGLKVLYEKDDEAPVSYDLPRPAHNEISSFYIMRALPMSIGQSVFVETFASKKSYTVQVQVLQKERFQTKLGEVDTIKVKPELLFEGVYQRKGDVYVWLTNDERRIPVKVKGAIRIGSLVATLADWQILE